MARRIPRGPTRPGELRAKEQTTRILLIEDDEVQRALLDGILVEALGAGAFSVGYADRLSRGLVLLRQERFDLILLDLMLPDSQGFETFAAVRADAPHAAVIVLTGVDDDALGARAIAQGAQDFLTKGKVPPQVLGRSLRYAIERHRRLEELRNLALVDELTGLYNRRGFMVLAWHELKVATRTNRPATLLFVDVDGLKHINDTLGHDEGDAALVEVAAVLQATFRQSDIVARVGGDEFCALLVDDGGSLEAAQRLRSSVAARNATSDLAHPVTVSIGAARYDTERPCAVEELIARADASMYRDKRHAGT